MPAGSTAGRPSSRPGTRATIAGVLSCPTTSSLSRRPPVRPKGASGGLGPFRHPRACASPRRACDLSRWSWEVRWGVASAQTGGTPTTPSNQLAALSLSTGAMGQTPTNQVSPDNSAPSGTVSSAPNEKGARAPDVWTLNVGVGEGIFGSAALSVDRNWNWYGTLGVGGGFGTPVTASLTGGWLNTSYKPSEQSLKSAITGASGSVSAGFVVGGGSTGNGTSKIHSAGLFVPQASWQFTGTKFFGNSAGSLTTFNQFLRDMNHSLSEALAATPPSQWRTGP